MTHSATQEAGANPQLEQRDARRGDLTWQAICGTYQLALARYFQRRIVGHDVEDLVQEVFARLMRCDLQKLDNLHGYIFKIAVNVLRDRSRRLQVRGVQLPLPEGFDIVDDASFPPDRLFESRQLVAVLVQALGELPPTARTVFSSYHLDGVSQVEIARQMGVSLSTVEKNMAKANTHLLSRMRDVL